MNANTELFNNDANLEFLSIVQNEEHIIKTNYDNGEWQDVLLSESGLYEFTEEWNDSVVCYLKRVL